MICSLMGIRHFVFAVNKMDLVDFDEEVFDRLRRQVKRLMGEFSYESLAVIPVSATDGDNIIKKSFKTSWYQGPILLSYLEEIDVSPEESTDRFTMAVQRVSRPNQEVRGFQGQIDSGKIRVGDEVTVLPSGEFVYDTRQAPVGAALVNHEHRFAIVITLTKEVVHEERLT